MEVVKKVKEVPLDRRCKENGEKKNKMQKRQRKEKGRNR